MTETDVPRCCRGHCRRMTPIIVYQGPLSGRWYAATRWIRRGDNIEAIEKHELTGQFEAELIRAGWTPPADDGREVADS